MKHLRFLVLLSFLSIFVLTLSAKPKKYPVLEFDTFQIDLGTMKESKSKKVVKFNFKNVGKKKFVLLDLRTSCGCVEAKLSKDVIKPGESGQVIVTFNGSGYPLEKFQKAIYLITNCQNSEIRLVVSGTLTE